jgi:hypothetical protein
MRILAGLLDRVVLLLAVLAAGCVPSFIVQYRQRAGGRLDQLLADLAPFQAIADRNHGGSLAALVRYHLQSSDPTFHQEGEALQSMLDASAHLRAILQGLDTDLLHQCAYLLMHHDAGLARATWNGFQPAFSLTVPGVVLALVIGGLLWALFVGLLYGIAALMRASLGGTRASIR